MGATRGRVWPEWRGGPAVDFVKDHLLEPPGVFFVGVSTISWVVSSRCLTKAKSLFRRQGPKVKSSSRIMSGPIKDESRVVSQGEFWNHDLDQLRWASHSLFLRSSPSVTLAIDSLTTPVWST